MMCQGIPLHHEPSLGMVTCGNCGYKRVPTVNHTRSLAVQRFFRNTMRHCPKCNVAVFPDNGEVYTYESARLRIDLYAIEHLFRA